MEKRNRKDLDLKNGIQDNEKIDKENAKHFKGKKIGVSIIILIVLAFIGWQLWGPVILWADISAYENDKILIQGLTDEEFYVTPKELAKLKLTKVEATGKSQKAGTVYGVGPSMDVFLAQYGKKVSDFKQVKFYASDDYTSALVKSLQEKEVILSISNGNKPLETNQQPLRIIIPKEDSGKWVRLVTRIEFTAKK